MKSISASGWILGRLLVRSEAVAEEAEQNVKFSKSPPVPPAFYDNLRVSRHGVETPPEDCIPGQFHEKDEYQEPSGRPQPPRPAAMAPSLISRIHLPGNC